MRGLYVAALVAVQTISSFNVSEAGTPTAGRLVSGVERVLGDRGRGDQTLEQIVGADKNKNYALYFGATWCHYCKQMKPTIEAMNKDYIIYMVDGDSNKSLAKQFNISGFPTIVIMNGGKEVTRYVGLTDKDKIASSLKTRKEQDASPVSPAVPDYPMMKGR